MARHNKKTKLREQGKTKGEKNTPNQTKKTLDDSPAVVQAKEGQTKSHHELKTEPSNKPRDKEDMNKCPDKKSKKRKRSNKRPSLDQERTTATFANPKEETLTEKWSKSKKKRMRKLKARQGDASQSTASVEPKTPIATIKPGKQSANNGDETATTTTTTTTTTHQSRLLDAFKARLAGSRFRILNEELYTKPSTSSFQRFTKEPELYEQYHTGFRQQVEQWPVNPVNVMITSIVKSTRCTTATQPTTVVVADFGCGDAALARQLLKVKIGNHCPFVVHSFDLVAGNDLVTACDMANTPLSNESVDIAVFCLALMGTNLADFIREAHRVLKPDGCLKIAEVRSRFESKSGQDEIQDFVHVLDKLGFDCISQNKSNKMFLVLELQKNGKQPNRKLSYTAKPCIYKRR